MNGTDPAPQDVSIQNALLAQRQVKVFIYNQQVTDSLTQSFLATAKEAKVPVVGVYETMPTGYDYQRWMMAELNALRVAVSKGLSTTVLH
jgi:zinc/manganese transport system substrate-binding protein